MQVRLAKPEDKHAWDCYVDNHPSAVSYARFAWKEAIQQAYGHKSCYLLAEEAGEIKGILPLFDFRIPLCGHSLISLPYCDAGDILADNGDVRNMLLSESMVIAKKSKAKELLIRSLRKDLFENTFEDWLVDVQTDKVRMCLMLPGSSEELWKSFKSKLRSQVRKAEKNGLHFRWGTLDDLAAFYQVFSQNMLDLGSPVHSRKWIEKILANYGESARMGLVFKEDIPVGCGIILFTKHTVSIPWASTLREYNRLSPNMMLYWNFLKFSADNEKKIFDFGRSTPNEGTYRFKKQWGAEPEQLFWYSLEKKQSVGNSSIGVSREWVGQQWAKMPLALVNIVGPYLRRYISL